MKKQNVRLPNLDGVRSFDSLRSLRMTIRNDGAGGFTLIELILYVALVAIFITGVATFGVEAITIRAKVRVEEEVISNTRFLMKRIAFEIRNASAINSVSAESVELGNSDSARNPTVIAKSGNTVTIGWGSTGPCPTSSPCNLVSDEVRVDSLIFTNMSDLASKSANIRFATEISSVNPGGPASWDYSTSSVSTAELRSR